ncbi:MAG: lysophospholipid acyltransferase family protein [Colwellia sp.]
MNHSFKNKAISNAILILVACFKPLKRQQRKWLVMNVASLILRFANKTRTRAIANIRLALPELNDRQVNKLAFSSYQNIVYGVFEIFWLEEVDFYFDIDEQSKTLLLSGEPLSIATMHMSCYEIVPYALQKLTFRSTTLSNIPKFFLVAEQIYQKLGINCFNKKDSNSFIKLLGAIRSNQVVSLHSDHYAKETQIRFFNKITGAPTGVAMLSAIGHTPILLAYAIIDQQNKYRICIETVSTQPVKKSSCALQDMMQKIYQRFEKIIIQHPEQWYWSYNRWRKSKC